MCHVLHFARVSATTVLQNASLPRIFSSTCTYELPSNIVSSAMLFLDSAVHVNLKPSFQPYARNASNGRSKTRIARK